MFDRAFADLAVAFSAGGNGPFWQGRVLGQGGPVRNDEGDIVTPGGAIVSGCMVQVDAATDAMRQTDGFVDGDVRLLILDATLEGPLSTDNSVEVMEGPHVGTYSLQSVSRDPVAIGYECRARK